MKTINIDIRGKCGAGKSTLAFAIQKILNEAGINCEIQDEECPERATYYASNLNNLADRKVIITQTQISRN